PCTADGRAAALHKIAPDKAGIAKNEEQTERDGIKLPALREPVPKTGFKSEAQHAYKAVEHQYLDQSGEYRLLHGMTSATQPGVREHNCRRNGQCCQYGHEPCNRRYVGGREEALSNQIQGRIAPADQGSEK